MGLPRDLFRNVASRIPRNEAALYLKLVCKRAAEFLSESSVCPRLPSRAPPGAKDGLTHNQRVQLMCLTVESGVLANVRLLVQGPAA
jgi:hypothetical protein